MASIANLNVRLTANTSRFTNGFRKAERRMVSTRRVMKKLVFGATVLGGALLGLAGVGGGIRALSASFAELDRTAKVSDRLGIASEELIKLRHAADIMGASTETVDKGLQRMLITVDDARQGLATAADAFERLQLSPDELASMTPDEAFKEIADAISQTENQTERLGIAYDIFGRKGIDLLNVMQSGRVGIEELGDEAERLGLVQSRMDLAKIEQANDSITRLKALFQGAAQTAAVQLAPIVTAVASRLTDAGSSGEGMGQKVINAVRWVGDAIGKVIDFGVDPFIFGFKTLRLVGVEAVADIADGLKVILDLAAELPEDFGGGFAKGAAEATGLFVDEMRSVVSDLESDLNDFLLGPTTSEKIAQFFDDIEADAAKIAQEIANSAAAQAQFKLDAEAAAAELERQRDIAKQISDEMESLQRDIDTFGLSDNEKRLFDLEVLGASPEQIEQARALMMELGALADEQQRLQDLQDRGRRVFEQTRTPLEEYEQTLSELNELLETGTIDWDTYGRAIRQAKEELEGAADASAGLDDAPDLIRSGSAQAQRLRFLAERGAGDDNGQVKQLAEQKKTNQRLERINNELIRQTELQEEVIEL